MIMWPWTICLFKLIWCNFQRANDFIYSAWNFVKFMPPGWHPESRSADNPCRAQPWSHALSIGSAQMLTHSILNKFMKNSKNRRFVVPVTKFCVSNENRYENWSESYIMFHVANHWTRSCGQLLKLCRILPKMILKMMIDSIQMLDTSGSFRMRGFKN